MEIVLWVIAINWLAPFLLFLYPLLMILLWRDFEWVGFHGPFIKFRLSAKLENWHAKLWKDWGGVGLYFFMCYRCHIDKKWTQRTILHEGEHCKHWAWFGLMFYVLYVSHSIWIFLSQKIKGTPYTKHPYLDNWSERLARKRAGQAVDIKPEHWPHSKGDLWPWW